MVVASIRVQAGTTLTYSYRSDCYKPHAAKVSTLINLFAQILAFAISFRALPFGQRHRFHVAWGTFAAINFVAWLPLVLRDWKGEQIRKRRRKPKVHEGLEFHECKC
ncbi:hypothetical protein IFM47457_01672 [Aspergillus lentulus]|nr:hypothetical protein IFM47457_01672 [Aspergillus lentulus]